MNDERTDTNENENPNILKRIFVRPPIVRPPQDIKNLTQDNEQESIESETQEKEPDSDSLDQETNVESIEKEDDTTSDNIQINDDRFQFIQINGTIQEDVASDEITPEEITPIREPSLEIIGTAHISDESVNTVKETIYEKRPEIVAIELDPGRYQSILDDARGIKREQDFDIRKILRTSNLTVTIVNIFLSSMQRRMGREVGVKPGAEMLEAVKIASEVNANVALIDRNIQVTLRRTIDGMSFREKVSFVWELILSLFMSDEDEEDLKMEIESLKEEDTIEEVMDFFKTSSPGGYNALVHERDAYLAYNIKSLEDKNVVAIVGAGHKKGIETFLDNPDTIPPIESISEVKEKGITLFQVILFLIPIVFIALFVISWINGINIEGGIVRFLIFVGGGALIGSLLSGSKIQSALVGMVVTPVTIIHPLLAAGWFSGLVEARLRHVSVDDLVDLSDFEDFHDLWHNNLFRVILVALGTNLGCTIGFLVSINNVFIPYIQTLLGI